MSRSIVNKLAAKIRKQMGLFRVPIDEERWAIISSECGHSHNDGAVCVVLVPNRDGGFVVGASLYEALKMREKMARLFAQDVLREQPNRQYAFKCSEVQPNEWEGMRK